MKDKKWGAKVPVLEEQDFYNIEDLSKEQLDTLKDRTIIGCDPGKRSLVYMMDNKGNKKETDSTSDTTINGYQHDVLLITIEGSPIIIDWSVGQFQNTDLVFLEKCEASIRSIITIILFLVIRWMNEF